MSLLDKFVKRTVFESYEDFYNNFELIVPEDFNFAFDVLDVIADERPDKTAMVWCDDKGNERIFSFEE